MRAIRAFEDFLKNKIVRIQSPDKSRSKSLFNESKRRMHSLREKLEKIGIKDENANDYVEYCYDIIMFLIRAKLYLLGYSTSGHGAHEAEVSYMRLMDFGETDVQFVNQIRYFRNGILYYGAVLDKEYAEKVVDFIKKTYPKLIKNNS